MKYTILSGDTFSAMASGLSASAGVTYQAIESANPTVDPNALNIGMVLNIPASNSSSIVLKYTVIAGDSFSKISTNLSHCAGMTTQDIEQANPDVNPNALAIGQLFDIPETSNVSQPVDTAPVQGAEVLGFWWWTWSGVNAAPSGTNLSIAFSGWTDPTTALQESANVKDKLQGSKYISLGGGNEDGAFTSASLTSITNAINAGDFAGYDGIAYDVEEGDSGLESLFSESFAAAKANGYKVLVTVSHSAPYGISDASDLMQSFFADPNIDYLSPQLYTTGEETSNDYATSGGVEWSQYATAKAAVVPSIVNSSMYADAQIYFQEQGVSIKGFVQWSQPA
ncbi:MAG: LysM peptidoglycan-binding domain-containing protein [Gallionellaceae bacterium]